MDTRYAKKDNIDRISVLPKEVRCHILSFLSTKDAAGTSILSTQWKNLLPLIPNLQLKLEDIDLLHPHPYPPSNNQLTNFQNFAHNLLNFTLRDTPSIHSLTLICHKIRDEQLIASWITAALHLNIKIMKIRIRKLPKQNLFLNSLYGSTLVSLSLIHRFSHDVTEFRFSLPKLKKLYLHYRRSTPLNALLAACPVLNSLKLVNLNRFKPGQVLLIRISSLMYFKVVNKLPEVKCVVELEAPQLLYMCHSGHVVIYNMTGSDGSWIACVDYKYNKYNYTRVSYYYIEQAPVLAKKYSAAQIVWLSQKYLSRMYRDPHLLPRFQKATCLTIMNVNDHVWELLPYLFDSAPNLRNLYLKEDFDMERLESFFKAAMMESISFCVVPHKSNYSHFLIKRKKN